MGQNGDTYIQRVQGKLAAWSCSASPEYYRGEGEQGGVAFVEDPERGQVLRCQFGFGDPKKSEPVFLTRKLDPQPARLDVVAVRFWAKLTAPVLSPENGVILRLRTSDTAHDNWNVQQILGKPFPVGKWTHVEVPTRPGDNVRNIWGKVFGNIRQMTFRLDDIDDQNGSAELLLDDIELVLCRPPAEEAYAPTIAERPDHAQPRVLLLHHAAAGYYQVPEALRAVAEDVRIDEFPYRGRHFEFFGLSKERTAFLDYDAIILLDIDPFVLTPSQALGIADAVASGASLICFGGAVSLSDAKACPSPLREALPVAFTLTKNASKAVVSPAPGPEHPLNRGFDASLLGRVARRQPVTPKPDTVVPWMAGDVPMVVAGSFHHGRTVVVNAQAQYLRLGEGDLFLSPLGDDFMRRLMAYALHREPVAGIRGLRVDAVPVGGGTVKGMVEGSPSLRAFLDDAPVPLGSDGGFSLDLPSPKEVRETHLLRVEAWNGRTRVDWRDVPLVVRHPIDLQVTWTRNRFTFEPDARIELKLGLTARDVPAVSAGPRTEIRYLDRWPVPLDSFADIWLLRDGKSYHNQAGPVEVTTTEQTGLRPAYRVVGEARAARPGEKSKYAADDRVLHCTREIRCRANGVVEIDNAYEFRQDAEVQRLPLTLSLPVDRYAGLAYRVVAGEAVAEGQFPKDMTKKDLFDVRGGTLEIQTPDGPLRIEATDPNLRVWCRDLRCYQMPSFRLEIEAPVGKRLAKKGERYHIPLRIRGPVPGSDSQLPEGDNLALSAVVRNPRTGTSWSVPQKDSGQFSGTLPNLPAGQYELVASAATENGPVVSRTVDCFVVPPLERKGFYPLMCYVDFAADEHCLDPAGIRARLLDIKDAGFNTAAISGPTSLASEAPSPERDARACAESVAAQLGMAISFEYSNFTTYRRGRSPSPCPFTDAGRDAVAKTLASRVDIANRTARLFTAKVVDEPHLSLEHIDWDCPYCQAEFQRRYGLAMADARGSEEPYARWACADFAGQLVDQVFKLGAEYKAAHATSSWQLLLTYMAMGLGYQNPQKTVQDALDWTRHAGWADFDIYPYFYPASQRVRMVQASYGMSYMREISRARGVPWGFYVELDDRNWPFQKNPKEASAECAFTAVAHGADYLNTFIHRLASTGCGARPERWELAKQAFRQINRLGPLLTELPALRSRLAVYHPNADEKIRGGYSRPDHTLELLKGMFGDLDVLPEQIVRETGSILLLLDAEYLHAAVVDPLQRWLKAGGVLVCDQLPTRTHRGDPIVWSGLAKPTVGADGLRIRVWGKGRVVFLPENPEPRLQELAEGPALDPAAVTAAVNRLATQIETAAGPMPMHLSARDLVSGTPCIDTVVAGLRGTEDRRLVTVVNHRSVPVEATIRLNDSADWVYRDAIQDTRIPALTVRIAARGHRVLLGAKRR
jgi:hypothetical protein